MISRKMFFWTKALLICTGLFLTGCSLLPAREDIPKGDGLLDPYEQAAALGKGVVFGNLLDSDPEEGAWSEGYLMQESDFDLAVEAGFDSVRIPMRFGSHAEESSPYTIDADFLNRAIQVVDWGLERDLRIIVDMHHYLDLIDDPYGHKKRFCALWRQLATQFKDYPDTLYYEILNEPNAALSGDVWNNIMYYCLLAIREIDNHHTVIIGGSNYSNFTGLEDLIVSKDETNAIVTFHYYAPYLFTMQGKDWFGPDVATTGIVWPGPPPVPIEADPSLPEDSWVRGWINDYNTDSDVETNPAGYGMIRWEIAQAAEWGIAHSRPLWMGEFGVHDGADLASRSRWIQFVRGQLDSHGIPWSYWTLDSDPDTFLYDRESGEWVTELTGALGLTISGE